MHQWETADYQALVRATGIGNAEYVEPGYVMGPEALAIWAENLTGEDSQESFIWLCINISAG